MRVLMAAAVALMVGGLAGCVPGTWHDKPHTALSASTYLKDRAGQIVGLATFVETTRGTEVMISAVRMAPGPKGLHIHAVGLCEPPEFASAGSHFNPGDKSHGGHAGDLPNIVIGPEGFGRVEVTTRAMTLRPGKAGSLIADKGTAVVIHAQPDDEKTDPAGNSGDRIACGVIVLQP